MNGSGNAAQGTDGRTIHGEIQYGPRFRRPTVGGDMQPPADVDAFPKGASPFGVMDLTGNVWQWTRRYVDDHTRRRDSQRRRALPAHRWMVLPFRAVG